MDAFFAAIEALDRPELDGKPLLVGFDGPRGVVSTASYEARKFGCHSAQPMAVAKRLCPQAIVLPVRGKRYREFSKALFQILDDFSPLVQPLSVDEAFVDLTGTERALGPPRDVAEHIKQRIANELRLTASVGVAPNKFLAKIASDFHKPNGLTVVPHDGVQAFLDPLPIGKVWGVGPVTLKKFERLGICTVGDLRAKPADWLERYIGNDSKRYYRLARGLDDRPVVPDHEAKSIGHEQTFGHDIDDPDAVRGVLLGQVDEVARRLRRQGKRARTVNIKIRYGDFETITRALTLDNPTDVTNTLWEGVKTLYDRWAHGSFKPVRLIGASVSGFSDEAQMGLFTEATDEKRRAVDQASDAIVARFGKGAVKRGETL
jgi:DNA polymerase-4